jgi:hypothetical protein
MKTIHRGSARRVFEAQCLVVALAAAAGSAAAQAPRAFHFDVTADPHMGTTNRAQLIKPDKTSYLPEFKTRTLKRIMARPEGPGRFMVICGDLDDFDTVRAAVADMIAGPLRRRGAEYPWYPVVGNHDVINTGNVTIDTNGWRLRALRAYATNALPGIVSWGPDVASRLPGYEQGGPRDTTYSFDYGNCHFIVLDEYCKNDWPGPASNYPGRGTAWIFKPTQAWLSNDLSRTTREHIFVFGHEPAPREAAGSNTFWNLLADRKVTAYIHGHDHVQAVTNVAGVWRVSLGRGATDGFTVFVDGPAVRWQSAAYSPTGWVTQAGAFKPAR